MAKTLLVEMEEVLRRFHTFVRRQLKAWNVTHQIQLKAFDVSYRATVGRVELMVFITEAEKEVASVSPAEGVLRGRVQRIRSVDSCSVVEVRGHGIRALSAYA